MNSGFLVAIVLLAIGAALWMAWRKWTPVLRFRAQRHYGRVRNVCSESLQGATARMITLLRHPPNLGDYQEDFPPFDPVGPGEASLVSIDQIITPAGYSPSDPKVSQLLNAVMAELRPRKRR